MADVALCFRVGFSAAADDPKLEKMPAAERKEIAGKVQARVYDQVIYVPLGQYRQPAAWRASLSGVVKAPIPVFWNMEKKG